MQVYHFVTNWFFDAPIEQVWNEIVDAQSWPHWWPSYRKVTPLTPGSTLQVGSRAASEVRGKLPYSLRFIVEVPSWSAASPGAQLVRRSGRQRPVFGRA